MPSVADIYRRFRRPYRVRWTSLGPPRLEPGGPNVARSIHQYGSLVERITRIFLAMDAETVEAVLRDYRERYGDGAYAYARRTISSWQSGQVKQVGHTVMRLLEIVPHYVDLDTKFELARIVRDETLKRILSVRIVIDISPGDDLSDLLARLKELIDAQLRIELPPGILEGQTWLSKKDAALFQQMLRDGERNLLTSKVTDFILRVRFLQRIREDIVIPVRMHAVFELPTALVTVRITKAKLKRMSSHELPPDESFLAKWNDLELESRFKSGDVSYPAYVLRNMDQFFSKEEQSELHKIAAMHGLELERLLMEIQIKSRTSEADLQKLVTTLKTLQEKGITADIVSRHETPSGHIEISARSRKRFGCLPPVGILIFVITCCISLLR